jgi:excisionase family DNA binding protein
MEEIIFTRLTVEEMRHMFRAEMQEALAQLPPVQGVPEEDLLTTKGACKLLNLAQPTIYGLVHQQAIPCMKRGSRLYFSKKELIKWVAQGRKSTQAELEAQAQSFLATRPQRKRD